MTRGVVDRIESGTVVILLEKDGETVAETTVPAALFPDLEPNDVVDVEITTDDDETAERKADIQDRFDDQSERP